jgi:RNA polymerase sigma-70 factor (ECF subfamily)
VLRAAMTARMDVTGNSSGSSGPQRSEQEILRHFLDSLNGPSRTILVLYIEGLTHEEIADVTGLSQSAVGVRIHRMKKVFTDRYVERAT